MLINKQVPSPINQDGTCFQTMKVRLAIFFLFFLPVVSIGQINLVPNPGFEDTIRCPSDSTIIKTKVWYNPTCGSPDYFYPTIQGNPGCINQYPAYWGVGGIPITGVTKCLIMDWHMLVWSFQMPPN